MFKDGLPEIGRPIIFGNHMFVDFIRYHPEHHRLKKKLEFLEVIYWRYIDFPPDIHEEAHRKDYETKHT
jgi:hypothetical protein